MRIGVSIILSLLIVLNYMNRTFEQDIQHTANYYLDALDEGVNFVARSQGGLGPEKPGLSLKRDRQLIPY